MGPADWDAQWNQLHPGQGPRPEGYHGEGGGSSGGYGVGGGVTIPAFKFDWQAAEQEALQKLTPYYNDKLAQAQGDVDRAKRLIEEDYARGARYRAEDQQTQTADNEQVNQQETRNNYEDLNKRGLLFGEITGPQGTSQAPYSQFATQFYNQPLQQKQDARQKAIQRALARQEETAQVDRTRGIEEQNIQLPRTIQALNQEKQEKAINQMAPLKYQQELTKYNASIGGIG